MRQDLEICTGEELRERMEVEITLTGKITLKDPQTCENQGKWSRATAPIGPGVAEMSSRFYKVLFVGFGVQHPLRHSAWPLGGLGHRKFDQAYRSLLPGGC